LRGTPAARPDQSAAAVRLETVAVTGQSPQAFEAAAVVVTRPTVIKNQAAEVG
jgi:hypothetical protein